MVKTHLTTPLISEESLTSRHHQKQNDLLRQGYAAEDDIYVGQKTTNEGGLGKTEYSIYDAESGEPVSKYIFNDITGYYEPIP